MHSVKDLKNNSVCIDKRNIALALITNSNGDDHPYKIPYRLFWDYDHDTIFQGANSLSSRDSWDWYINQNDILNTNTNKDTQFYTHRTEYVQGAMKIRYGKEPSGSNYSASNLNPLKYEPVFLVLEKDLLYSATNGDMDEDNLPDRWEEENELSWTNSDDNITDDDNDGLTNIQEYNNGVNSTDPQNEDTDGDGFKDGAEIDAGTDPLDELSFPNKTEFPLTLNSATSTTFNVSWTPLTGATKYKLCFSTIDEVSYETAQTCDSLIDGSFLSETTNTNLSFSSDKEGNLLQKDYDYYMRVVAYNDSDEVVGVSGET